jgi:hypothetical protein
MRGALTLFGVFTACIVIVVLGWLAQSGTGDDFFGVLLFDGFVVSPWLVAFVLAALKLTRERLLTMSTCSVLPSFLFAPAYHDVALGLTESSTSALVFAVFPFYHLAIIGAGIAILLVRENKRPT